MNEIYVSNIWSPNDAVRVIIRNPSAKLEPKVSSKSFAQEELYVHGLIDNKTAVMPSRLDLRKQWYDMIRLVLADGEPRYFPIHRCEGLSIIGLSLGTCREVVWVHLPRRAVCSRATVHRLSALVGLTPREREVLECLSDGLAPKEISQMLGTQLSTVRTQTKSILSKVDQNGTRLLLHFLARLPDV